MSDFQNKKFPDPARLAEDYFERFEKYSDQRREAYRFHSDLGRELFTRFRFYIIGLMVAGIAYAILNRDFNMQIFAGLAAVTSVRVAIIFWAIGISVGLFSIQTSITSHFVDANAKSVELANIAETSGLSSRQFQRIASGLGPDKEIDDAIAARSRKHAESLSNLEKKRMHHIRREFFLSSTCNVCFLIGSIVFALPLFL